MDAEFKKKPYDIQNKIEYALPVPLTPVCVFDSRKMDPSGPLRMFIGLDACVFGDDGLIRKICVGDTENDIWEIVQTRTAKTQPFKGGKLTHFSEGQSGQVHGIAPYPLTLSLNSQDSSTKPFATASGANGCFTAACLIRQLSLMYMYVCVCVCFCRGRQCLHLGCHHKKVDTQIRNQARLQHGDSGGSWIPFAFRL